MDSRTGASFSSGKATESSETLMNAGRPGVRLGTFAEPKALEVDGNLVCTNEKVSARVVWATGNFVRQATGNAQ